MPEKKYYFIHYEWSHPRDGEGKNNAVLDVHPVHWLKNMIELFQDKSYKYRLTFYEEILKEEYDRIEGWIN